jgi:hypothetical protein
MCVELDKSATTFVVQVQFQRNATWQGTIDWLDARKTQRFRSVLEMIKLMDEALADGMEDPAWLEEGERTT